MPVRISQQGRMPAAFDPAILQEQGEAILARCGRAGAELSILLCDDAVIRQLNADYRGKDRATNVLAFAQEEGEGMPGPALLGDVVISLETAAREARQEKRPLPEQATRLLIHGLLHLLGHDHERSSAEAESMFRQEAQLLASLTDASQRRKTMPHLAINVDHVATLRQARGGNEPDPVTAAAICELAGAAGIVVHLREDRRHIQDRDLLLLRQTVKTKLNLEMAAAPEIIKIALQIKPEMVTLVPEKRRELTTEGGLDVAGQRKKLAPVIARLNKAGIPVSLFIDPDQAQIEAARAVGATFVEIHTGRYADAANEAEQEQEFALIADAAARAAALRLRVNAGHGLNYRNTARVAALEMIEELSIGHAVMARAILVGLDQAVREMLALLK